MAKRQYNINATIGATIIKIKAIIQIIYFNIKTSLNSLSTR